MNAFLIVVSYTRFCFLSGQDHLSSLAYVQHIEKEAGVQTFKLVQKWKECGSRLEKGKLCNDPITFKNVHLYPFQEAVGIKCPDGERGRRHSSLIKTNQNKR